MLKRRKVKNIFMAAVGGPATLVGTDGNNTLYRKELAYPGTFVKTRPDGTEEFELEVDEPLIDHWVRTFSKMQENEVQVPVPLGHVTDPERRRGTVETLAKEPSDHPKRRGQPALFAYIRFNTPEAGKQLCNSNVSLFMPPAWYDGKRNRYSRPIQHVAITDYPVIPGLTKFEPVKGTLKGVVAAGHEIALAEDLEEIGQNSMETTWEEVAQELGIECPEGEDPKECVKNAWTHGEGEGTGEGEGEEMPPEVMSEGEEEFPVDHGGDGGGEEEFDDFPPGEEDEEEPTVSRGSSNYEPPPSLGFSLPPTIIRTVANTRIERLRGLMNDRKILKPQFDDFVKQYCGVNHVGHALSMEAADPGLNDGFENLCVILSKGKAMSNVGERTGHQVGSGDKAPIVRMAEQRAQQANGTARRR